MARPKKQIVTSGKRGNGRGSVTKYKGTRYRWRYRDAVGKLLASGITATKQEAEEALTQVKSDNLRGLLASPDQITFTEYAVRWLAQLNVRPITREGYQYQLNLILPTLGKKRLKDIKPTDIKDTLTKLSNTSVKRRVKGKLIDTGQTFSSRTIGQVRQRLKTLFREAVTDQIIYVSPAEAVKPIKKLRTERPHIALDFDQIAKLHELGTTLYQAGLCRLWVAVFTAMSIGLRKSEVMGLRWQDIDLEQGLLQVRHTVIVTKGAPTRGELTKTEHSRRDILIPESLKAALAMHQAKQLEERHKAEDAWQNTGAVFATKIGEWTHPDNLQRTLRELSHWSSWEYYSELDKRGVPRGHRVVVANLRQPLEAILKDGKALPHITPHDLRHTAGTLMLRRGVPIEVVSKTLGHADIAITYKVYRHVLDSEKRANVIDLFPSFAAPREVNAIPLN
jgi:integrase